MMSSATNSPALSKHLAALMSVPFLDYFLGRRPLLVADLAGAEDMAAAPASLDVFDAVEQVGGAAALFVDAAHLGGVGGDISTASATTIPQQPGLGIIRRSSR
jgi:hypothetical protein